MSGTSGVYLDWNATTPPHADVVRAMHDAAERVWANPSSVHAAGRAARDVVETAREAMADLVGAHPRDVLFTSGGTEANNLALSGASAVATSRVEHPSVVRVAERLAAQGIPVVWLSVDDAGRVEVESVREALERLPAGVSVAVQAANHETGVIQPVEAIAEATRSAGATLHVDAVQAVGKVGAEAWRGADSVALAGHKIRGPKGIGALAWWGAARPRPLLVGGAQERGLRPGTLDPVAAAGLLAAARRCSGSAGPARYAALAPLRDRLERVLSRWGAVNGAAAPRLPHVSNVSVTGWPADELIAALDLQGVRMSSGAACSAGTVEASVIVTEMLGPERGASAVRASLGDATSAADVDRAISVLEQVLGSDASGRSSEG